MAELNPIIQKIINVEPNTYIIFYVPECTYCQQALDLLRTSNVKYKGYNIHQINGSMQNLLEILKQNATLIGFDSSHRTKPIIFLNGKFLGGTRELSKQLHG